MKKQDWILIICVVVVLTPFFIPATGFFEWFKMATQSQPYVMAFFKFAILATLGEMLGLRIKKGVYNEPGFGIVPRMMVWGFLGMCIQMAMVIFKSGVPSFMEHVYNCFGEIEKGTLAAILSPAQGTPWEWSWARLGIAFCVSVLMNSIFAPVMMTFHKCTDIHILDNGGTVLGLLRPMKMREIMAKKINWDVQWNLVFKKTIPLFWFPAHTITFILPGDFQVLFAALLGVALGLILALAGGKKK
ncbi:MAG: hypothetical protein K5864_05980 [Bacteroidales bacterium]|nr:hypothetical protein [Bacteroidales bacterium]